MCRLILIFCAFLPLFLNCVRTEYRNNTNFLKGRDSRRIRTKLITFDTTETDIEIAFQFNVPFVAVPSDRSIGNFKNSLKALANLNLGSVALAGLMIAFGSIASFFWRSLYRPASNNVPESNKTNESNAEKDSKSRRAHDDNQFIKLMYLLEKTVQSNINPTMCVQHFICSISRKSEENVKRGCGTSTDKILNGIFSANWIVDMIENSAIHDAIRYGEFSGDCHRKYDKCGLANSQLEKLFNMLMISLGQIKS